MNDTKAKKGRLACTRHGRGVERHETAARWPVGYRRRGRWLDYGDCASMGHLIHLFKCISYGAGWTRLVLAKDWRHIVHHFLLL